jgi:hypothetical protein
MITLSFLACIILLSAVVVAEVGHPTLPAYARNASEPVNSTVHVTKGAMILENACVMFKKNGPVTVTLYGDSENFRPHVWPNDPFAKHHWVPVCWFERRSGYDTHTQIHTHTHSVESFSNQRRLLHTPLEQTPHRHWRLAHSKYESCHFNTHAHCTHSEEWSHDAAGQVLYTHSHVFTFHIHIAHTHIMHMS